MRVLGFMSELNGKGRGEREREGFEKKVKEEEILFNFIVVLVGNNLGFCDNLV